MDIRPEGRGEKLKWFSHWIGNGRWKFFGYYYLALPLFVIVLRRVGFEQAKDLQVIGNGSGIPQEHHG